MAHAVFFDRDGTLMVDVPYLADPGGVQLLPGAAEAVRRAREAGREAILVTNQSGVARGLVTLEALQQVHDRLAALLAREGARLDAIYFCPHHPTEGTDPRWTRPCSCRKPAPGLLLQAARERDLELASCFLVGDSPADQGAAAAAGVPFALVGSPPDGESATRVFPSALTAVRALLEDPPA